MTDNFPEKEFLSDEAGQDIMEYTLLLAAIALAGSAAFMGMGSTVSGLWRIANSRLAAANTSSTS